MRYRVQNNFVEDCICAKENPTEYFSQNVWVVEEKSLMTTIFLQNFVWTFQS